MIKTRRRLFEMLRCPECKGPLDVDESRGSLHCGRHGQYPIQDGIPCFAPAPSFEEHWRDFSQDPVPEPKKRAAIEFLRPLVDYFRPLPSGTFLDAGCGNGVHAWALTEQAVLGAEKMGIGVDISSTALQTLQQSGLAEWAFIQADILRLPFQDQHMDAAFSFGALAYTHDPQASFRELCRVVKAGGLIGIWISPRPQGVFGTLFALVRWMCTHTTRWIACRIADCVVPFLGFLPTRSGLSLRNASWRQCREVVLVNVATKQLTFPSQNEVEAWFMALGLQITHREDSHPITLWGKKL